MDLMRLSGAVYPAAAGFDTGAAFTNDNVEGIFGRVYRTIARYAVFACVIALAVCGFRMITADDPQTVQATKKYALRIAVGLVLILASEGIVYTISNALGMSNNGLSNTMPSGG